MTSLYKIIFFVTEITCLNENEDYLLKLILDVGYLLKNVASAVSIRCIRVGFFSVESALLKKHFTLENILYNMKSCYHIIERSKKIESKLQKLDEEAVPFFNGKEMDLEEIDEELREFDPELKAY